ncbi:MAG: hypothetical protein FJ077_03955, partial [Cyanobacteria bacterium K_DeepCast_35m_m2_023]|nr:hypothetical protein [Cyanobacteria bacterium K_DeepCast_35m_m2_023]
PTPVNTVPQPTPGTVVTSGTVALTDPNLTRVPVVVRPTAGSANPVVVAVATPGAQAVIDAGAGSRVEVGIGIAGGVGGGVQNLSGSVVQVSDGSLGNVVVNYQNAVISGTGSKKVDGSIDLGGARGGSGTIASNAPPGTFNGTPDTYIQTGAGNDAINGTVGIDFIRAGAGNDTIDAGAGNDIVRPGAGNDEIRLGPGNDVVYLTVDQLQGNQTKVINDFSLDGPDKIQIASNLQGLVSITGQGTKTIVITLSGAQTGRTTITSNGQVIGTNDIQFV